MRLRKWIRQIWLIFLVVATLPALAGNFREEDLRLKSLAAKIKNIEKDIHHLIEAKSSAHSPEEAEAAIQNIKTQYTELQKVSVEYHELLVHIKYKHPEKGDETERKYTRYHLQTIEEMEESMGLDGKLDRIRLKMDAVYKVAKPEPPKPPPPPPEPPREPASTVKETSERLILKK